MKFNEFEYKRPTYEDVELNFINTIDNINNSNSSLEEINLINELNKTRNDVKTMQTLVSIRYSVNTEDEYYEAEKAYWDEYSPIYENLDSKFYKCILNSKFKDDLINEFGNQFFNIIESLSKSFSNNIIPDLQRENELCSKYTKLLASAKLNFDNKELNLSSISKYMIDTNRDIRESASKVYYEFFEENEDEFDEIYDELIKIRHNIAIKLGFENFVEVGYLRMMRTDYDYKQVSKFREQIKNHIVPLANKLYERQRERLNLDKLTYVDENLEYLTGNATPKGSYEEIISSATKMYDELSKESGEFFRFMLNDELMDLVTKKSKAQGGYCTYIPNYKSPFIFSNFNQTSDDIDVLTHEAGHAFQLYMSNWIDMPEINFPTLDSCEIHSMSMEFITWPWMNLFFKEDTEKYKFTHMSSAIKFMPYGVLVDEFQHEIYKNPNLSKDERKKIWRELEKTYIPHRNYEGCELLEKGTWWFKQGHIFKNPFYYIDYALAQICSLQFWKKSNESKELSWNDYMNICKVGGSKSFLEIISTGNLISPFDDGCVESVVKPIENWLDSVQDKKL